MEILLGIVLGWFISQVMQVLILRLGYWAEERLT
jgi:hypothetical protein